MALSKQDVALSKQQLAAKAKLYNDLIAAREAVEAAVVEFNETVQEAMPPVAEAVDRYNTAVQAAAELAEEVASDIQNFIDDKSEKWQESDRGQEYATWAEEWNSPDLFEEVKIEFPSELETPEMEHGDTLDVLPDAV